MTPVVRADIVDVYVFRRAAGMRPARVEFLQLRRVADGTNLGATWQPIMGHVEPGETAVAAAMRELDEEAGLDERNAALLGVWALEQVHPYFLADKDCIMLSPRFAAEVTPGWEPILNNEHDAHRWVGAEEAREAMMWPGQAAACEEIVGWLLRPMREPALAREPRLRVHPPRHGTRP
jgi:8-oxo-dGTP pyrophosphatase MutT (NUDIX family)